MRPERDDSEIGHFIQADTIIPGAGNPLAFNRYAYVTYNPIRYTDPSGHWFSGDHYDPASAEGEEQVEWEEMHRRATEPLGRYLQVNLDLYQAKYQYADEYKEVIGYNGCGLLAPDVSAEKTQELIDKAHDAGYDDAAGIQPSNLVELYQDVFGIENVEVYKNLTMAGLYRLLESGYQVIVDIMVNASGPGIEDSVAHFARVIGIDMDEEKVYVANTLGGATWEISFELFENIWTDPENRASSKPSDAPETVNHWAVAIKTVGN